MRSKKTRVLSHLVIGTALGTFGSWQAMAAPVVSENDIIVTAQRRAERLVDVPMSITAVSASTLNKAGVIIFRDLDQVAVGVKMGNTGIFSEPSIRGITSFLTAAGADSNVALYVDGFYQADPLLFSQDLVNLQDIQVLKGPQGALYGRNATGGAILIRTLDPTDKFTGRFSAGYGNLNDLRGQGYLSIPLAKGLSMSASGGYRHNDGWVHADVIGKKHAAPYESSQFNTKLKWDPTDNLSMTLGYNYGFLQDATGNSYNLHHNLLPILAAQPLGTARTTRRDHVIQNIPALFHARSDTVQTKMQWKPDFGILRYYFQYLRTKSYTYSDDDKTSLDYTRNGAAFGKKTWDNTLELEVNSINRLNFVVGANYFIEHATGQGFSYSGVNPATGVARPTPVINSSNSFLNSKAFAAYIDGTYSLTDQLFLSAGVRYTSESKRIHLAAFSGAGLFGLPDQVPFPNVVGSRGPAHFHSVTPRATLRYEIEKGTNVYASYSQGFKAGTFNTSVSPLAIQPPVKPEKATNYEIGFKMARPRFRVEGAVYYTEYKDLQVSAIVRNPDTGILGTLVTNAGGARNYGAELNVTYMPEKDLNLHAGIGYTHARYRNFPNAVVTLLDRRPCVPVTPTCPVPNNPNYLVANQTGQQEDFSGLRLERAPDWTINAGFDYTAHVRGGSLIFAGNAAYSSKYAPTTDSYDLVSGKQLHIQKGYVLVNGQVTYHFADDHTSLGIWGKNIFDTRYKTADTDSSNGSYMVWAAPRTFGFTAGYEF